MRVYATQSSRSYRNTPRHGSDPYCTNGQIAAQDSAGVTSVNLPPDLAVVADYGLTVLDGANKVDASRFALFILSPTAQKIFADHGFEAPLLP
jgi:molybdate transport system substrate-binding protein